jgi:hypothetical protein
VLNESLMAVSPHRKFGFFPVVGGVYCGGGMVKLLLLRGISGDGGFSGWYVRLVLLLGSFPRLLMLSALMDCRWHWTASSSSSLDDGMADGRSTKMMRRGWSAVLAFAASPKSWCPSARRKVDLAGR